MTVRLDLKPDMEARLTAQAESKGIPLDAYLQGMIEEMAQTQPPPNTSIQEFRATLDTLAEMGKSLPHRTSSAFSRQSIYQDHD